MHAMSKNDQVLNLDKLPIPLSSYNFFSTNNADDINMALSDNFHDGYAKIFQEKKFKMVYNYVKLGDLSLNAAATSSGFNIHANNDMRSFALIYVTHGKLEVRARNRMSFCIPNKFATVLDFEHPSVISVQPFYNNVTLRFTRAAIEQTLEKLVGVAVRNPLRFVDQIDLSRRGPQRLIAIVNQVITLFEQDTALPREPLLVGQYEQLLLTALLTCLDHNAQDLLRAPSTPAPPKIVKLVEAFIEANADKPLNLGDLSALTGMSARSIQLAFQKHRGYSPSRFLRGCRLARARDMLRRAAPGTSLLSIALASGFASQSLFCRLYRQRFGETPSETAAKS
jgi:AraC-like DNA-binding protein